MNPIVQLLTRKEERGTTTGKIHFIFMLIFLVFFSFCPSYMLGKLALIMSYIHVCVCVCVTLLYKSLLSDFIFRIESLSRLWLLVILRR